MKSTDSIPALPGGSSIWGGWQRSLGSFFRQISAEVEGLRKRVTEPAVPGVPRAYRAERVFAPETAAFNVDVSQNGVSSTACNFVVRDAQTYTIPVIMPGPGVFVARYLNVAITQRLFQPGFGVNQLYYSPSMLFNNRWTTKFSLLGAQPLVALSAAFGAAYPFACNFFWNVVDARSGRKYADDVGLSSQFLLPRSPAMGGVTYGGGSVTAMLHNGGFFEFDVPWLFERDGQAELHIRFINPILQFASSVDDTPFIGFDSRENGTRNQAVTVAVELLGEAYQTDQDAIHAGALSFRMNERGPRASIPGAPLARLGARKAA